MGKKKIKHHQKQKKQLLKNQLLKKFRSYNTNVRQVVRPGLEHAQLST